MECDALLLHDENVPAFVFSCSTKRHIDSDLKTVKVYNIDPVEGNAYFISDFYKKIFNVLEMNDYIYFTCIGPKAYLYEGFVNKKTEEVKFGKWDYVKSPHFFFSDGVFLYGYYNPDTLIERKNNGNDLNICFDVVFDSLNDISIDDNPVLVKVLLKDF